MNPCLCETQWLVRKIDSLQREHFGNQCQGCGKFVPVKKDTLSLREKTDASEFDEGIAERFWAQRREDQARESWARRQEWWGRYTEYLLSPKWRDKRDRVLARDHNLCQACLRRQATQVHHTTYEHVFDEPLFELVSICKTCHDAIHHPDSSQVLEQPIGA